MRVLDSHGGMLYGSKRANIRGLGRTGLRAEALQVQVSGHTVSEFRTCKSIRFGSLFVVG